MALTLKQKAIYRKRLRDSQRIIRLKPLVKVANDNLRRANNILKHVKVGKAIDFQEDLEKRLKNKKFKEIYSKVEEPKLKSKLN